MRARVLGPVGVEGFDGRLGGARERTVLAVLALHTGRRVGEDVLAWALWDDDPPRTATKTVQSIVARLRRSVGDAIEPAVGGGYRWTGDVDLIESEHLVTLARAAVAQGELTQAGARFDQALALWHDRPLADAGPSIWVDAQARRLEELRHTIADERVDAWLACGRAGDLVPGLEAAVDETPLRERRWAQLITALYRAHRQADALRAFQRLRTILAEELGIEPSPELQSVEAHVLRQTLPAATHGNVETEEADDDADGRALTDDVLEVIEVAGRRDPTLVAMAGVRVAIGRAQENDVILEGDTEVSRRHAFLEQVAGGWVLHDLGSRNGTFANGERVHGPRSLRGGDEIRVGTTRLVLRVAPRAGDATTVGAEPPPSLTSRERDVLLALFAAGGPTDTFTAPASTREVAASLGVSEAAVKQHLANLYDKFDVGVGDQRRLRLANAAVARGAVRLADVRPTP